MVVVCIITALILIALLFISLYKAGSNSEDDSEYYVDGYHIYYDRKILRYNKNKRVCDPH